jgi:hypothetical protein
LISSSGLVETNMTLSADRNVDFFASQELIELPVDDNIVIYKGALVGRNRATGYARPLVAGDDFLGVAYERANNTAAGHVAGGFTVRLHQHVDIVHALLNVAAADIGKDAYASADDTLTLTPTGNSRVGRVVAADDVHVARVRCQPVMSLGGVLDNWPVIVLADANAALTLDHVNHTLLIANTAARTLTLPAVASVRAGGWLRLIKTNATAQAVTLDGNGSETIDGAATFAGVDAPFDGVLLVCTGTEWVIASRDLA